MQRTQIHCLLMFSLTATMAACLDGDDAASVEDTDDAALTTEVSSASQLMQALAHANPGDTIAIAPRTNLGKITIDGKKFPRLASSGSKFFTLRSSGNEPAVFEGLDVLNVTNFRMTGVKLSSISDVKESFVFEDSENVELTSTVVQGRRAKGLGTGNGVYFHNITTVTIANNDFLDLRTSLFVSNSTHVRISGNHLLGGSYDTIHFGTVNDVIVEDNTIRAFPDSSVKHVDYMQFTNMGSAPASQNITIRNNDFRTTNSVEVHGIYLGNYDAQDVKNGGPNGEWYKNVLIENNYIECRQMAAIAVSYAVGVTVRGNTLKRAPGPVSDATITKPTVLIEAADTNVVITGNTTVAAPRAGHLITGWINVPIPGTWKLGNNTVVD